MGAHDRHPINSATGFDALTTLLGKLGLSSSAVRTALQVLAAGPRHQIPDVILTMALIGSLSL